MFTYKVHWYLDNEPKHGCGIVVGKTYAEAMENLVDYFGETEMVSVYLAPIGDSDKIISCSEEMLTGLEAYSGI